MTLREQMKADLRVALKNRQKQEASMLRTLLAAFDNAEAVDTDVDAVPMRGTSPDVPRKELSTADIVAILRRESAEVQAALAEFEALGVHAKVTELRRQLAVVDRYLGRLN